MLRSWTGKQTEGHLYPERFSRTRKKFSVTLFVIGNPLVDGFLWNITRRRQLVSMTAKSGKQKRNKLSFLFNRKNINCFLNFQ